MKDWDDRPEWKVWHGWLMVVAWALAVAVVFWFLAAPPWDTGAGGPGYPTSMGGR